MCPSASSATDTEDAFGVDNRVAYRARIRHVDIVHAYACASYQFEIAGKRLSGLCGLFSRAYHQGVYAVCIDVFSQTVLWNGFVL